MSFDYQKFIDVLASNPTVRPDLNARLFLHQSAKLLILSFKNLDPSTQAIVSKDLRFIAKKVGNYKSCFVNSLLYALTKERKYLQKSLQILRKLPVSLSGHTDDFWALSLSLRDSDGDGALLWGAEERREYLAFLHAKAVEKAKETYGQVCSEGSVQKGFTDNPRVVLITSQLLAMGHAPTEIALNYARILQKDHGKQVLLVNSCEYSSKATGAIVSSMNANAMDNYSNFSSLTYEDETFGLFQPNPAICSDEGIEQCIAKIDEFDPALIIVIGNSCSFAEAFLPRSYVIYSPTANAVPYVTNAKFHMHDAPREEHLATMEKEGIQENYEFFLPGAYEVQTKRSSTTRNELGLPEGRPVFIVVGNRLNHEITEDFLTMLEGISSRSEAFFFFLGAFNGFSSLEKNYPNLAKNALHHEYLHDIMAVYEHCDVYLNPKRAGGGTSAVYAMQAGVPVLSLPYGDVSFTASQFPAIKDYSAMEETAVGLATGAELLTSYKAMAEEGCKAISGLSGVISKILEHYELYAGEHQPQRELAS